MKKNLILYFIGLLVLVGAGQSVSAQTKTIRVQVPDNDIAAGTEAPRIYAWDASGLGQEGTWNDCNPGAAMSSVGNGYYSYELPTAAKFLFTYYRHENCSDDNKKTGDKEDVSDTCYKLSWSGAKLTATIKNDCPPLVTAAVTMSPGSSSGFYYFNDKVTVTLTAADASATAIRYTTDGTKPTATNGTEITGKTGTVEISADDVTFLQAVAIVGGVASEVSVGRYAKRNIDVSCLSAGASPESATLFQTAKDQKFPIKVFAKGATSATYSVNGGTPVGFTNSAFVEISRSSTIEVTAVDSDGKNIKQTYNYTVFEQGKALPTISGDGDVVFDAVYPKEKFIYRNEPAVIRVKMRGENETNNHHISFFIRDVFYGDSGNTWKPSGWEDTAAAVDQKDKLANYLVGNDGDYSYYQFVIKDIKTFLKDLGSIQGGTIPTENLLKVFDMRAWVGTDNANHTKYRVAFSDGAKNDYSSKYSGEFCLTVDQYQNINESLQDMLKNSGNSVFNSSSITWYMDDPNSFYYNDDYDDYAVDWSKDNRSKYIDHKYFGSSYPWVNSYNLGTVIYYAKVGTDTYKVNVTVKPYERSETEDKRMPLFLENFGTSTSDCNASPLGDDVGNTPKTNYGFISGCDFLPNDGKYSLVKQLDETKLLNQKGSEGPVDCQAPPTWNYDVKNLSAGANGLMYVVNADETANGQFYQQTINVCENMEMRVSAWFSTIMNGRLIRWADADLAGDNYPIKPNIHMMVTDAESGELLAETWTGELQLGTSWTQYFLDFKTPAGVNKITYKLENVFVGGGGNDFAIDDIRIERKVGTLKFDTPSLACIDPNKEFTIEVNPQSVADALKNMEFSGGTLYYQWEETIKGTATTTIYKSGNINYTVGNTDISAINLIFGPGEAETKLGNIYTLTLSATPEAFGMCGTTASYELKVSNIDITTDAGDDVIICPGHPVTLKALNADIPDDQIIWIYKDADGNEVIVGVGEEVTIMPTETREYTLKGLCENDKVTVTIASDVSLKFGSDVNKTFTDENGIYTYRVYFNDRTGKLSIPYHSATGLAIDVNTDGKTVALLEILDEGSYKTVYEDELKFTSTTTGYMEFTLKKAYQVSWEDFTETKDANIIPLRLQLSNTADFNCAFVQFLNLRLVSPGAVWTPESDDTMLTVNNWNDDKNWKIYDPKNVNPRDGYTVYSVNSASVPMPGTKVIIPGDKNNYPELKASYADSEIPTHDNFNPQPICNEIYFESGAELAKPHYLEYLKARVEVNVGAYQGDKTVAATSSKATSKALDRNRFYTMAAPLKGVVVGDLGFGGKPNVYLRYADAITYVGGDDWGFDEEEKPIDNEIKFTKSLPWYNTEVNMSTAFAYAVDQSAEMESIDSGTSVDKLAKTYDQKNSEAYKGILVLPNFEGQPEGFGAVAGNAGDEGYGYSAHHKFTADESYFRYFKTGNPDSPRAEENKSYDKVTRGKVNIQRSVDAAGTSIYENYRFVAEDANNEIPAEISVPVKEGEVLFPNPFMSHLDFGKFYTKNQSKIGNYYRIWDGTETYTVRVNADGTYNSTEPNPVAPKFKGTAKDLLIRPMQSVLIPVVVGVSELTVTEDMSVTYKGGAEDSFLRNGSIDDSEQIKVVASTDDYASAVVIVRRPNGTILDNPVSKLFTGMNSRVPELYIQAKYPVEIGEYEKSTQTVPVALKESAVGEKVTLTFEGLENVSDEVRLYDAKTKQSIVLDEDNASFSFVNEEGSQIDRFFIQFAYDDYTDNDNVDATSGIAVTVVNKTIKVTSIAPIDSVEILNPQGQIVSSGKGINDLIYQTRVNGDGVYLVNVIAGNKQEVAKVVIY